MVHAAARLSRHRPALGGRSPAPVTGTSSRRPAFVESKIPLGVVQGQIDHLSADLARQRLFVAELGNGSLGVVDLPQGKVLDRIDGLKEPQGVSYGRARIPCTSQAPATARSGATQAPTLLRSALPTSGTTPTMCVSTPRPARSWSATVTAPWRWSMALLARRKGTSRSRPTRSRSESRRTAARIFVNVPKAHEIAVVDRDAGKQVACWKVTGGTISRWRSTRPAAGC